jgi:hypothetical protein
VRVTRANVERIEKMAKAALENERLTRERVEALEPRVEHLEAREPPTQTHLDLLGGILGRGLWGRFRWLVSGR